MRTQNLLFTLVLVAAGFSAQAQQPAVTQKFGYADWEYIFLQMPEYKQIEAEMTTHRTQLENSYKAKAQEFETKLKAFQSLPPTTSEVIKADKERELQMMQESIQAFQQSAQENLAKKNSDLMKPVYDKVGKNIELVAKENGYSFIINSQLSGTDILLYSDEKFDVSDLVLKKMGVTPQPTAQKP